MYIPAKGFIIFKVKFNAKGKATKTPYFHGLSTMLLAEGDQPTDEILKEICYKMSTLDQPTYYYFNMYEKDVAIQIFKSTGERPLDS